MQSKTNCKIRKFSFIEKDLIFKNYYIVLYNIMYILSILSFIEDIHID